MYIVGSCAFAFGMPSPCIPKVVEAELAWKSAQHGVHLLPCEAADDFADAEEVLPHFFLHGLWLEIHAPRIA